MEILVVMALITAFSTMGFVVGIDSYQRYVFRSDLDKAVTLLQTARSSAMNNIGETSHGVYFCDPSNAKYVLFRGSSYLARNPAYDFAVDKDKAAIITSCPAPQEIVFAPLSGETVGGTITLGDGVRNATIIINNEGGIDW